MRFIIIALVCFTGVTAFGVKLPLKAEGLPRDQSMVEMKNHFYSGSWKACLDLAPKVARTHPLISDWVLVTWLRCLRGRLLESQDISSLSLFLKELKKIETKKTPTSEALLRLEYQNLMKAVLDLNIKKEFRLSLEVIDALFTLAKGSAQQRARFFVEMGRLHQDKTQPEHAKWFLERAYKLDSSNDNLALLNEINQNLNFSTKISAHEKLGYRSQEEIEMVKTLQALYLSKDAVALFKESVQYLRQFPLGFESEKVEIKLHQMLSDMASSAKLNDRDKLSAILLQAPYPYLEKWFKKSLRRGDYELSLAFAEKASQIFETPDALWVAGRSLFYLGRYSQSEALFLKIIEKYPKFSEIEDVLFKLSFGYIRAKKWSSAQSWLERLSLMNLSSGAELVSKYWLIRVQEKQGAPTRVLKESKKNLINKFPLTYYGLILQSEVEQKIQFPLSTEQKVGSKTFPFTEIDEQIFKRLNLLASNKWFDEAVLEWRAFDNAPYPDFLLPMAESFYQFGFSSGMTLLLNDFDLNSGQTLKSEWFNVLYAKPFSPIVLSQAEKQKIDPLAVWSLMRQESLFLPLIESPSEAIGLMQIIPPTAKEISMTLKRPIQDWSLDGRRPDINIEFGSWYLKDLIRKFDNSFPLALAAYNYGPTRLKVWKGLRDLSAVDESQSPFSELWIDELPASETQFYVKAVLRNAIIYKRLGQENFKAEPGFWRSLILSEKD